MSKIEQIRRRCRHSSDDQFLAIRRTHANWNQRPHRHYIRQWSQRGHRHVWISERAETRRGWQMRSVYCLLQLRRLQRPQARRVLLGFGNMRCQSHVRLPRVVLRNDGPAVSKAPTAITALGMTSFSSRRGSFAIATVAAICSTGRADFDFRGRTTVRAATTFAHRNDDHFLLPVHEQLASFFLQFFVLQQTLSSNSAGAGDVWAVGDTMW